MLAMERSKSLPHFKMLFGGDSCGDPPVPIPNTEVKPAGADGTWGADPWESRKPPNTLVGAARTAPVRAALFIYGSRGGCNYCGCLGRNGTGYSISRLGVHGR